MKCKNKVLLYAAHILVPLLLGTNIYLHSAGDTYITKALNSLLPPNLTSFSKWDTESSILFRILRFYFCDAAWAYALTFSIAPLLGNTKIGIIRATVLCSCFCILLELIQMRPGSIGTFDPLDLIIEVIACIIAGTVYTVLFGRK